MEILPDIQPGYHTQLRLLRRRRKLKLLYWAVLLVAAATALWVVHQEAAWLGGQELALNDPCGLDVVFCPGEAPSASLGLTRATREAIVTAYTSEVGQTDGSPCVAASGMNICNHYAAGELLCASNAYPFGTKLLIDEYGTCTVVDRMSRRYEDRVDLYFGFDTGAAREWGVQLVTIKPL